MITAVRQNGSRLSSIGESSGIVARTDSTAIISVAGYKNATTGKTWLGVNARPWVYLYSAADQNGDSLFDVKATFAAACDAVAFVDSLLVFNSADTVVCADLQGTILWKRRGRQFCKAQPIGSIAIGRDDSIYVVSPASGGVMASYRTPAQVSQLLSADVKGTGQNQIVALCQSSGGTFVATLDLPNFSTTHSFSLSGSMVPASFTQATDMILVDVNDDGKKEIVLISEQGLLVAYNYRGSVVDGFPRQTTSGGLSLAQLFSAALTSSGSSNLNLIERDGIIMSINPAASSSVRYQLSDSSLSDGVFFPFKDSSNQFRIGFAWTARDTGLLSALSFAALYNAANVRWPMSGFDVSRAGFVSVVTQNPHPLAQEFFPKDRAYNWPNPVYGNATAIRYYLSQDATIAIRIFDLAGMLVAELAGTGVGGVDNEILWDVSNIQSGVYLAAVEATSPTGSGSTVIKIAVVK